MIRIETDRRTGRSALVVPTEHGEIAVRWSASAWEAGHLDGAPECAPVGEDGCETLAQLHASARYRAWLAADEAARAEALETVEEYDLPQGTVRALRLEGGPATGGARWVPRGDVHVAVATRRELLYALTNGAQSAPEVYLAAAEDRAEARAVLARMGA